MSTDEIAQRLPHGCPLCTRRFTGEAGLQRHLVDAHRARRGDRRGNTACGVGACKRTFRTESDAAQHRRDAHGIE